MIDLLPPLQRWLLFSGVLLLGGVPAWKTWIAPHVAEARELEAQVAGWGLLASLMLLPVWGLRLAVQVQDFRDPFAPLSEDLAFLVRETFWGSVWIAQGLLLVALGVTFAALWRRPAPQEAATRASNPKAGGLSLGWKTIWLGTLLLVLTLSLSSHAMSVPYNRPLAVAMDAAHLLAAAVWMGTLALILLLRSPPPRRASLLAVQLRAFSPLAMVAVGVLVFMGVVLSAIHLGSVQNLWGSSYGRVLSGKIAAAGLVLGLGFRNWRQGLPTLDTEKGVRTVRRRAALEVAAAGIVLLLTALLTGTSMPADTH